MPETTRQRKLPLQTTYESDILIFGGFKIRESMEDVPSVVLI